MQYLDSILSRAVDIAWGIPLVVLLITAGVYFTIVGRFVPFRHLKHAVNILRGKYDNPDDPGEINHFQALSSALSATIGMGNISGVAIGITIGGPGAIFWMWVAGIVGMSTKYFTCTLACLYRKKDECGIEQGGPMYFIEVGLGKYFKPLAIMFAVCGMVGCLALFQVNQLSGLLENDWGIGKLYTGTACMLAVGIVILGGIVRVGQVTSRIVPVMFSVYVISALYIILSNASIVPGLFKTIIASAFGGEALVGGGTAIVFKEVLINGIKRAAFSNEAGIGTAPMAHGAAKTNEPVREGLIAMLGPFLDTNLVCTMTALVILATGAVPQEDGVVMTVNAFEHGMPGMGRYVMTLIIIMFSISTMISYSYYSLKCSRYLFGYKFGSYYVYVYILSLPVAAVWSQDIVINLLDTSFALMAIPTLVGALLLSPNVIKASRDYFARLKSGFRE
ncbi:MAG TPA: sodium:alanine symporter family protein [candidate division Zixibacteria bacterium]|nr:sodium:alanine symporter family protein [candidate division Zixibacteria bacterium]HEQ98104.1 sodium:alanine symporter family protein [candidate division Zixibacteria bacterium]